MDRPLLFVPGYRGQASHGLQLARSLGQDDFAAVYREGREASFRAAVRSNPPGTAYAIQFSDRKGGFTEQADELTAALEILREETGLESDVVAHSMGGLVTREHLDRGEDDIHDLIMLGVPNHGVALARGADHLRLGWLLGEGPHEFRDDSPELERLNERWDEQREKVEQVVSVSGTRLPVLVARFPFMAGGDGAVAAESVSLPGVEQHTMSELDPDVWRLGEHHRALLSNPRVLALVEDVLAR
ncbi:hypothetical protein DYH09_09720 [bacterium CPR1]|nr:hypothetical protein [bacterium CPR1]